MQRVTVWGGFLCGLAGLLALVPMQAAAQDYVVSSGMEGGYYHEVGTSLTRELVSKGRSVQHETSHGSLANLARLDDAQSPVNVALALVPFLNASDLKDLARSPGAHDWIRDRARAILADRSTS